MTTTIKVAKAFNLLLTPTSTPVRFEIGEHEVEQDVADHWFVQLHLERAENDAEAAALDPATATRDELLAYMRAGFEKHLVEMSDEELRHIVALHLEDQADHAEDVEIEEDEDELPPEPETPATGEGEGTGSEAAPEPAASIDGGAGNDSITGTGSETAPDASASLTGGQGGDSIAAGAGDDSLSGGAGNDTTAGAAGQDSQPAADAADSLGGGNASDAVDGAEAKKPARGKAKPDA